MFGRHRITGVPSTRLDADEGGSLLKVQKPGDDFLGNEEIQGRGLNCEEMAFLLVICGELALVPELTLIMGLICALLGMGLIMYCAT